MNKVFLIITLIFIQITFLFILIKFLKSYKQKIKRFLDWFKKYKYYCTLKTYALHQVNIEYLKHFIKCNDVKVNLKKLILIFE